MGVGRIMVRLLYAEAIWIEVQIGMLFQIGSRPGWGGIRVFVYYTDKPVFLQVGFSMDRYW